MKISSLDLNLLVVFQAIYVTHSVTQAGERVCMTQSAVSAALKRLRERFKDPLFVRTPEGMVPTPLAERLIGPVRHGLDHLAQAIAQGEGFDPASSDRIFHIAVNDIGQLTMVPLLLATARRQAPLIRFETVEASFLDVRQRMLNGQIDLALGSWEAMGRSFYQQRIFDESFVVLMRAGNPVPAGGLDTQAYLAASHVAYRPSGRTDIELQKVLSRAGLQERRHIVLGAAHSLGLGAVLEDSDLLLTVPSRLARAMVDASPALRIEPLPCEIGSFPIRQQWHERYQQDGGSRWLRELIFKLFHEPPAAAPDQAAGRGPQAEPALCEPVRWESVGL
ncbi:LysR family transcriptional regulator [Piscinibacter sp.]|uniref:LysR family transcriptional regulator n=1 Tax=Piscinibacter sp. TaxID=1903157 RepID=UPI0039E363E0